ncbi:MAG: Bifunctional protein HldE [Candidatus Moanabacter tarae]|uniref:Bifunctional protein HldE n=1 Tax=Candidatus Moanibacter tarae TaxID=2200854 RepID=A0A2Z4AQ21_9BACT|nr:MAG: Bifunctional protein HldE [Candidatus Moanabacter tarae]|tara:strand:- start:5318 stop:5806 length:489 start_codon:yes stop_codon:yes gene_type:complete
MSAFDYNSKILSWSAVRRERTQLREEGKVVVFTNGCFDVLHLGHLRYLTFAREQGDCLMVGLNSDASVRRNKGAGRPIVSEMDRALMLSGLVAVDFVVIFDQDEPCKLIGDLVPDVLVKGQDWMHYVSGREIVEKSGGKVVLAKLTEDQSTTRIIESIQKRP